jgi:hypothetical protein
MNLEQAAVFLAAILYFVLRLIPEEESAAPGGAPRSGSR